MHLLSLQTPRVLRCDASRRRRSVRAAAFAPDATDTALAPAGHPALKAQRKKVVIVGAGWAGFGAAKHLASQVRSGGCRRC